jgi:hypothetical protein
LPTIRLRPETGDEEKELSMDIILWILFGLVVGVVANFVFPGPDPGYRVASGRSLR